MVDRTLAIHLVFCLRTYTLNMASSRQISI